MMTLEEAHEALQEMGHVQVVRHEDHLCIADDPHYLEDCPLAPHFAFSEDEIGRLATEQELGRLIGEKLQAHTERLR